MPEVKTKSFTVLMKPVNKASLSGGTIIVTTKDKNESWWYKPSNTFLDVPLGSIVGPHIPHYLYIISDDDINEGDYYFDDTLEGVVCQCKGEMIPGGAKKIIATTDHRLSGILQISDEFVGTYSDSVRNQKPIEYVNLEEVDKIVNKN